MVGDGINDSQALAHLLHGAETRVWGDSAYVGQTGVIRRVAPKARDFTQGRASRHKALSAVERAKNRNKSTVRAKVEHAFLVIKRRFGRVKVCDRGLKKNIVQLTTLLALTLL